jgi:hypothetical protein
MQECRIEVEGCCRVIAEIFFPDCEERSFQIGRRRHPCRCIMFRRVRLGRDAGPYQFLEMRLVEEFGIIGIS